jgi:hypothetical protein
MVGTARMCWLGTADCVVVASPWQHTHLQLPCAWNLGFNNEKETRSYDREHRAQHDVVTSTTPTLLPRPAPSSPFTPVRPQCRPTTNLDRLPTSPLTSSFHRETITGNSLRS